ncbi:MAG: anti-sigma factor antagonist [Firmicutes bacterium]|nr:anti-sigma factor antagonist [Bacillota bacterium]
MASICTLKYKDKPVVKVTGRIDSTNAPEMEAEIAALLKDVPAENVVIDAEDLEYISSAGLRVLLRLRRAYPDLKMENASSEVYEILEMTGFTEILPVSKAYRKLSIDGCEIIGEGANGCVYRLDQDTIVKVYNNPDSLPDIHKERELARTAFIMGIPTAIPYDVVRVDDFYGSVFELLNARSFAELLMQDRENADQYIQQLADLLKLIHGTKVKPGSMPDMKKTVVDWVDFLKEYLPAETWEKLRAMVDAVPDRDTMLHGDFHAKNVMMQNGEVILIDMDTLCMGHPVFEMGSIFNAYTGFYVTSPERRGAFIGLDAEMAEQVWNGLILRYADGDSALAEKIEQQAALIGFVRLMRRLIRRNGFDTPEGRQTIAVYRKNIEALTAQIDSLTW